MTCTVAASSSSNCSAHYRMRFSCLTFWSDKALAVLTAPVVPSTENPNPENYPPFREFVHTKHAAFMNVGRRKAANRQRKGEQQPLLTTVFQPFLPLRKKEELEIVSRTAQGPAGNQERT